MSEFEDGILPYMQDEYGEFGINDSDIDLDLLGISIIEPDTEFDDPETLMDKDYGSKSEMLADGTKVGLSESKLLSLFKELRHHAEDKDPRIAALGHLGLISILVVNRQLALSTLDREDKPTPPNLYITEDTNRTNSRIGYILGMYYESLVKTLSKKDFSEKEWSLSTTLTGYARSSAGRESYKSTVFSSGDSSAFGLAGNSLLRAYEDGDIDPEANIAVQAAKFRHSSDNNGAFEFWNEPDDDAVKRLGALRNAVLNRNGLPLEEAGDVIDPETEDDFDLVDIEILTEQILAATVLNERELTVVKMRFGLLDGKVYTQPEIASEFGVSDTRVGQIEKKALSKMRIVAKRLELQNTS